MNKFVENMISFWMGVGVIWFLAAIFNPNIDSGMVWLLAFIYSSLYEKILSE